jgi:hypothetical protein
MYYATVSGSGEGKNGAPSCQSRLNAAGRGHPWGAERSRDGGAKCGQLQPLEYRDKEQVLSFVATRRYGSAVMIRRTSRLISIRCVGCAVLLALSCKTKETPAIQPARASEFGAWAAPVTTATPNLPAGNQVLHASAPTAVAATTPSVSSFAAPSSKLAFATTKTRYAILISVDGLAPRYLEELLQEGKTPTFATLQKLAAWTHHARTDTTYTITLPNHTSMITGLPVSPSEGFAEHRAHRYTKNADPLPWATLHRLRDSAHPYTPSMFDVAHDLGLSTAMFATKSKFSLYTQTYNEAGGPDTIGQDNGRKKIDTVVISADVAAVVGSLISQLENAPPNLTFLHLGSPDAMGHGFGWGTPQYLAAVQEVDALLGRLLITIQSGNLANQTAIIITADHGGTGNHHAGIGDIRNFEIPFYVMAPGVAAGDAYRVFTSRFLPGPVNPAFNDPRQPLRNGDGGNVALALLGLPQIPDSVIQSAGVVVE